MKQLFTCLFVFTFFTRLSVQAQDPVKVLFIGNSFTAANDLHMLVQQFFINDGLAAHTEAYAPGGITVGDVSMGTAAHMNNPLVYSMLKDTDWDYVVLQDNQGRFALDSARFPNPALSKVVEGHLKIRDSLHYYHPCAKMIWFSGWGFQSEDTSMIDSIAVNYRVLNDSAKDVIAPIGSAWRKVILERPELPLWSGDGAHPDIMGSFLTAAVIYGTISGRDISLNPFNHTIPPVEALYLKNAAQLTLTHPDIRVKSNINGTASIDLNWTDPDLRSMPGYIEYRWYLGNSLQATTTSESWTPTVSGLYTVWAKDHLGYWYKSCSQYADVVLGIDAYATSAEGISVYPNPAIDYVYISVPETEHIQSLECFDMTGRRLVLPTIQYSIVNTIRVDLGTLASGLYRIKVHTEQQHYSTNLYVQH